MQAGFIGLGKMGRPMTQRLLAAGHTVHVAGRNAWHGVKGIAASLAKFINTLVS